MRFVCNMPAAAVLIAVAVAGCSSGSAGLSTASTPAGAPAAAPVVKPTDRALQVSATSARASKCGYNFDPARLRSGYLASETKGGLAPAEMASLEKLYDTTRDRVAKSITDGEAFCTDEQTAVIKRDLARHMAGDYTPVRKSEAAGWWQSGARKPWNPDDAFYPGQSRY